MRGGAAALCLLLAGVGCTSTAHRGEPYFAPPRLSERDVRGQQAFMAYCEQCHPGGEAGLGASLNDRELPALAIKAQVRAGLGAMPAFSAKDLPEEDLDALVGYLEALRRTGRSERASGSTH